MNATYQYTIIQAVPDKFRGERVNIGIAVFLGDSLDIRILPSLQKAQALNPNLDLSQYFELPIAMQDMFSIIAPDSMQETINLLNGIGGVYLDGGGAFELAKPENYEEHLIQIMKRFVYAPTRQKKQSKNTHLSTEIRSYFRSQNVLGSNAGDIDRHLVVENFNIDPDGDLYADFALKNGRLHLTETISFAAKGTPADYSKTAAIALLKNVRAKEIHKDQVYQIIVYKASFKEEVELKISSQLYLMQHFTDRCYNFMSKTDSSAYFQYMLEKTEQGNGQRHLK